MRLDTYAKRQLQKRATEFYLRLQHTNPFPAMVEDVLPDIKDLVYNTYLSCLPQHIRNAMLTLMADNHYIGVFDKNQSSSLSIKILHPEGPELAVTRESISFTFSRLRPSNPNFNHKPELDPEHPMRDEIITWLYRANEINQDYARCRNYIETIVGWANTAGQLRTMFPDYIRLLPGHQQEHIAGMKRRARLPKEADQEYLKKHRPFVAEKTALCLLLPEGGEKIWIN